MSGIGSLRLLSRSLAYYRHVLGSAFLVESREGGAITCVSGLPRHSSRRFSAAQSEEHVEKAEYDSATKRKILVNRLLYRSKQRGFLEMDLLLGLWAQQHVPQASEPLLAAFEGMLDLENPDLFKWLTGQEKPPAELENNLAFKEVQKDIGGQLRGVSDSPARTKPGKQWLRGWDDWKKEHQEQQQDHKGAQAGEPGKQL